jgi:acid phosphatase family membrane protein YuiD
MEAYGYLIAIIAAWFVAHVIKYVISKIQNKERSFSEQLFMSGGMPSSHSAVIMSVTTLVALREGITSPLFALSAAHSNIRRFTRSIYGRTDCRACKCTG